MGVITSHKAKVGGWSFKQLLSKATPINFGTDPEVPQHVWKAEITHCDRTSLCVYF